MRNLNISNIKFLDCTFRDGGYYCKWNFPLEIINQYFFAISSIGVEIVEIGYRSILQKEILGSCAYSTDEFLREIKNPFNLKIAVMVNAKELIEGDVQTNLQKLFPESPPDSPVSIVRIATSINNIKDLRICEPLNYSEFLLQVLNSDFVITDSGGIQEETSFLGISCFTIRKNTERPITIKNGTNQLVKAEEINNKLSRFRKKEIIIDKWDGKTSFRILKVLKNYLNNEN